MPLRLRVPGLSSSSSVLESESFREFVIGIAPYEPVPDAGEDRMNSGAFDMMPRAISHHPTLLDAIDVS